MACSGGLLGLSACCDHCLNRPPSAVDSAPHSLISSFLISPSPNANIHLRAESASDQALFLHLALLPKPNELIRIVLIIPKRYPIIFQTWNQTKSTAAVHLVLRQIWEALSGVIKHMMSALHFSPQSRPPSKHPKLYAGGIIQSQPSNCVRNLSSIHW